MATVGGKGLTAANKHCCATVCDPSFSCAAFAVAQYWLESSDARGTRNIFVFCRPVRLHWCARHFLSLLKGRNPL